MAETEWHYPTIERGSKLGIHSIRQDGVTGFAQSMVDGGGAFSVIKAVDDLGWLLRIKTISPETITVARLVSGLEGCGHVEKPETDLNKMADALLKLITDKINSAPSLRDRVDYWEVVNEPDPPGTVGYSRLSELMIKCMDRAEQAGLKLALFSLCAGTPEWDEMEAMVATGVFARARQGGHILTLHEGIFSPHDPIDLWWGHQIPGSPVVEGAGALCFRYRYLYHLLQQRDEVVPLLVSEWCGYDQGPLSPQQVVERVRWYDERARQDYWVFAFCPFTLGSVPPWGSHDYEFAYPAIVEYMLSIKDEENALPKDAPVKPKPDEDEDETACRGLPRAQYKRVYVLLPPDAGSAWAEAAIGATWDERRFTVGGSADDAGIGDLDDKAVVAVNPAQWGDDLKGFYETYYPGVTYVPLMASTPQQLAERLRGLAV
ncbi:MAG: hypothetical protein JXD18_10275 [Anaerolineae bacterium]|nr:hypothetical protein [Anaerolineae bacterium]